MRPQKTTSKTNQKGHLAFTHSFRHSVIHSYIHTVRLTRTRSLTNVSAACFVLVLTGRGGRRATLAVCQVALNICTFNIAPNRYAHTHTQIHSRTEHMLWHLQCQLWVICKRQKANIVSCTHYSPSHSPSLSSPLATLRRSKWIRTCLEFERENWQLLSF